MGCEVADGGEQVGWKWWGGRDGGWQCVQGHDYALAFVLLATFAWLRMPRDHPTRAQLCASSHPHSIAHIHPICSWSAMRRTRISERSGNWSRTSSGASRHSRPRGPPRGAASARRGAWGEGRRVPRKRRGRGRERCPASNDGVQRSGGAWAGWRGVALKCRVGQGRVATRCARESASCGALSHPGAGATRSA